MSKKKTKIYRIRKKATLLLKKDKNCSQKVRENFFLDFDLLLGKYKSLEEAYELENFKNDVFSLLREYKLSYLKDKMSYIFEKEIYIAKNDSFQNKDETPEYERILKIPVKKSCYELPNNLGISSNKDFKDRKIVKEKRNKRREAVKRMRIAVDSSGHIDMPEVLSIWAYSKEAFGAPA